MAPETTTERIDGLSEGMTWLERKELMQRVCRGCTRLCPTRNPYHEFCCNDKLLAALEEARR